VSRLLVLFDVDGTLFLTHDPLFAQALLAAVLDVYGLRLPADALERNDHSGQTTLEIVRELTGRDEQLVECCGRTSKLYVTLLENADTSGWEVAPNAGATLAEIKKRAKVALLTGNPEPVARARMERLGLGGTFPEGQGAFGCEREHRVDLIALARARANNHRAADTWTVGDTPTDIASAHAAGVRCVGVASGRFDAAELADADVVVRQLDELPRFLF
jgi:phosphoglycolate phosphatase-like HAD superfamily hydrolase